MTASEEEQQLLQQYQRMVGARDVRISQLQNENELVQDKCKYNYKLTVNILFISIISAPIFIWLFSKLIL